MLYTTKKQFLEIHGKSKQYHFISATTFYGKWGFYYFFVLKAFWLSWYIRENSLAMYSRAILLFRFNCSFNPLTFTKLWFWPSKKNYKTTPKFCICGSFDPQCQFWLGLRWRGTLSEVPHVIFFYFYFGFRGPKLLQMQNLRGRFVVFFLRGQNRNFVKVRGLKLQLNLLFSNVLMRHIINRHSMRIVMSILVDVYTKLMVLMLVVIMCELVVHDAKLLVCLKLTRH